VYQDRWIRGTVMFLVPVLALALIGLFALSFDPLTGLVIRHAQLFTIALLGGLLAYHLLTVGDAFAGGFRRRLTLRPKDAADHVTLALVSIGLIAAYGTVYRGANAWAGVAAQVFAPVSRAAAAASAGGTADPVPSWSGRDRLNVLVLGIDRRSAVSPDTENTDTIIVLSLDPLNRSVAMLSIPRDTLVTIPGHGEDKINAAYSYGGADLSKRAVEGLLDLKINSYALIDFNAFTKIVDSVGGVLVDVKRPIRDEEYPTADYGIERLAILAGPQLMDGQQALRYARSRHDSNDFSRARRQQEVIAAVRARIAQDGMLGRVPGIMDTVGRAVETNFDPGNVLPLASFGSGIGADGITSEVLLPCGGDSAHCELHESNNGLGYYLIPDEAKIANLVAELFYDPRVRQEAARVDVRGTGTRNGAAQDVADRLAARAFGVARVTSSGASGRSEILVRNSAKRYTADRLSEQLSGIPVRDATSAEQSDADIVVVVGTDFKGLATDLQR